MKAAALTMLLLIGACGNNPGNDQSFRDHVAQRFLNNYANEPPAPNAKMARELKTLYECTAKRIHSSDIVYGDSQGTVTAKVHVAMQHCTDALYGTATKDQ